MLFPLSGKWTPPYFLVKDTVMDSKTVNCYKSKRAVIDCIKGLWGLSSNMHINYISRALIKTPVQYASYS